MPYRPISAPIASGVLLLMSLTAMTACSSEASLPQGQPQSGNEPVAMVNDRPIPRGMFDVMIGVTLQEKASEAEISGESAPTQLTDSDREAILERLITLEAVVQEAAKQGFGSDDAFLHELALQRNTLIAQRFLAEASKKIVVDDAEIAEYYAQLPRHVEYDLRQIVTADEASARAAIVKLASGADFAQLAKETSQAPEAESGGSLGWLMPEQLHTPIAEAVRTMQAGTFTREPLQTPQGWHIVRVEGVRQLEQPPLETARSWIEGELRNQKLQQMIDRMRASAKVDTLASQAR